MRPICYLNPNSGNGVSSTGHGGAVKVILNKNWQEFNKKGQEEKQPFSNYFLGQSNSMPVQTNRLKDQVDRVIKRGYLGEHDAYHLTIDICQHNNEKLASQLILSRLVRNPAILSDLASIIKDPKLARDILEQKVHRLLPKADHERLIEIAGPRQTKISVIEFGSA